MVGWVVGAFVGLVLGSAVQQVLQSSGDFGPELAIILGVVVGLIQ